MAYRIKLDGTTRDNFAIGINNFAFDASAVTTPWTLTLPTTAGASGYALVTDGTGVTAWTPVGAAQDSTVPYFIPTGETYTVNVNRQALYARNIEIDGTLEVNGDLIDTRCQPTSTGIAPYYIPVSESYTVPLNLQSLFHADVEVDGTLYVDGLFISV
jgi:hypothetical protein